MAGYGYSYRGGYTTAYSSGALPTDGRSKTSYTSDHSCQPVLIDAEGRRKPVISYNSNGDNDYYVTKTEVIELPLVTGYKQSKPVRVEVVLSDSDGVEGKWNWPSSPEKWHKSSSPVGYHAEEKWNNKPSSPDRYHVEEKWIKKPSSPVCYHTEEKWNKKPSSPVRYHVEEKWNKKPSSPVCYHTEEKWNNKPSSPVRYHVQEKWNKKPSSPVRYHTEEKWNNKPSSPIRYHVQEILNKPSNPRYHDEGKWNKTSSPVHESPQPVEDFISKVQTQASRPNKVGPSSATSWRETRNPGYGDQSDLSNKERQKPTMPTYGNQSVLSNKERQKPTMPTYGDQSDLSNKERQKPTMPTYGAWAKPSSGGWSKGQGPNLSEPTSNINTAMAYLEEAAKPSWGIARTPSTIDSKEAERRYGGLSVASAPTNGYARTIDSREAARRYGGTTV